MMPHHRLHQFALIVAIGCACASNSAWAQEEHELAKQLANPIASLISVPFQSTGIRTSGRRGMVIDTI